MLRNNAYFFVSIDSLIVPSHPVVNISDIFRMRPSSTICTNYAVIINGGKYKLVIVNSLNTHNKIQITKIYNIIWSN
jgi:hypothetical protein